MGDELERLRADLAAAVAHAQEANKVVEDCEAKNDKLREALWQLLDDMGEDGLHVCQAAKEQARAVLEETGGGDD